ncbi:MAG: MBL fold metallo-hydrolase [Clostridia bacterium]|nr:MBL fold metallo-hydrolase [Clostridia bacterium]
MAYNNLFHAQVADGIFLISSDTNGPDADGRSLLPGKATPNSYLVIGKEKALLFDLAIDEKGLKEYAESLAGKPVMLALSHAHYDHIFHIEQFSEVWLHEADVPLLQGNRVGTRKVNSCPPLHYLAEGDVIDLGDRILDVIHIPGHTPGSVLLLDRHTDVLLSGDTGARRLLYGITPSVSLDELCNSLRRLKEYDFSVMYSAHDRCSIPKAHLDTMLDVIIHDMPHAKKEMTIPGIGTMLCTSRGKETETAFFVMASLLRNE